MQSNAHSPANSLSLCLSILAADGKIHFQSNLQNRKIVSVMVATNYFRDRLIYRWLALITW